MKKINGFESVKASLDREQLPVGGYVMMICDAKEVTYGKGEKQFSKLEVSMEVLEGEYAGFFAKDYNAQTWEDKKWRCILRLTSPTGDGSKEDTGRQSWFKTFTNAVEDSNLGYHWDWDESTLKGLTIGCVFRNEQWQWNGKTGWNVNPFKPYSAEDIRTGKFKVPEDKALQEAQAAQQQAGLNAIENISDDELPFK